MRKQEESKVNVFNRRDKVRPTMISFACNFNVLVFLKSHDICNYKYSCPYQAKDS